jgi:hypothetical protein
MLSSSYFFAFTGQMLSSSYFFAFTGQIRSELLVFFAVSVFEQVSAAVLQPGIVFLLGFACTPRFLLAILLPAPKAFPGDSPARVQGSRSAARSSIPDRTGKSERVRSSPRS